VTVPIPHPFKGIGTDTFLTLALFLRVRVGKANEMSLSRFSSFEKISLVFIYGFGSIRRAMAARMNIRIILLKFEGQPWT
jgi:hypothetical protein